MGFNRVETCTGPVVPRGGNLTAGSGSTVLFLLVTGMGILMGAGGALVANAWFMTILFNCEYSGFGSPLNYKGPEADASGKARFSGKIPQRSEDDFFRNRKA